MAEQDHELLGPQDDNPSGSAEALAVGSVGHERLAVRHRRQWIAVGLTILVVLAGALGGYWMLTQHPLSPGSNPGGSVGPSIVNVSEVNLTGTGVNISVLDSAALTTLTPGAAFNLSADFFQTCEAYGCSAQVRSVQVAAPFTLLGTSPPLPYNWSPSATVLVTLHLLAPVTPGTYVLNGTVEGTSPPSSATITALAFQTNYTGADSGYLHVLGPSVPLRVKPNATFSLTLKCSSSAWNTEVVAGLSVSSPFRLTSISVSFPQNLPPNGTLQIPVTLTAPPPGNYTLAGTVDTAPTPVVTLGNLSWAITFYYSPYYQIAPVFGTPPGVIHVGQRFALDMWIYNHDSRGHVYQVTGTNAGWTLFASNPSGNVTVSAGGSVEWVLTLQAPSTSGEYDLWIHIANWS